MVSCNSNNNSEIISTFVTNRITIDQLMARLAHYEFDFDTECVVYPSSKILCGEDNEDDMKKMWNNIPILLNEDLHATLNYAQELKDGWNEMIRVMGSEEFNKNFLKEFKKDHPRFARFFMYMINRIKKSDVYPSSDIMCGEDNENDMKRMWDNIPNISNERIQDTLGYSQEFKKGWNEMVGFMGSEMFNISFLNSFKKDHPRFARFLMHMINKINLDFYFNDI